MIWGVIVGTYSSIFIAGALLLYVQPQRGGQKKTVGQAERTAALDEDLPPARSAGGPEPEAALPEPEAPVANVSDIVRAADAAEAAIVGGGGRGRSRAGARAHRLAPATPGKLGTGAPPPATQARQALRAHRGHHAARPRRPADHRELRRRRLQN